MTDPSGDPSPSTGLRTGPYGDACRHSPMAGFRSSISTKGPCRMVAHAKSALTFVSAPFESRVTSRARPSSTLSGQEPAQFNPECARTRRTMAIDSTPNAISARRPYLRRAHPPTMRPLPQVLPSIAMSRVQHGKQDAHRCLTPGRNSGRGGTWSEGRRIRLRIR